MPGTFLRQVMLELLNPQFRFLVKLQLPLQRNLRVVIRFGMRRRRVS